MIRSIDISLQMILLSLYFFLSFVLFSWGHLSLPVFVEKLTHWFKATKRKKTWLYIVCSVCGYHQQALRSVSFLFFKLWYFLFYCFAVYFCHCLPLIRILKHFDSEEQGLCKEFTAAGQKLSTSKKKEKNKQCLTVASVGFSYDRFCNTIATTAHFVKEEGSTDRPSCIPECLKHDIQALLILTSHQAFQI